MKFITEIWRIIVQTVRSFTADNCFQYSAAVSFYTLFSMAPIVLITVYTAGIFVGNEQVLSELTRFMEETLGGESTQAVLLLVETIQTDSRNFLFLLLSIVFLMISATTVFIQFKDSFNRIFNIMASEEAGFFKMVIDRLMSFGMILLLGAAMLLSLILDSLLVALSELVASQFGFSSLVYAGLGSNLLSLLFIFIAVYSMFRILPDASMSRHPLLIGSLVTTLLLVVGKFGVGLMIGNSSLNELTGASSSVIILMLWVYYSSIIVFFGLELIKVLAERTERGITARRFARRIKMVDFSPKKNEP